MAQRKWPNKRWRVFIDNTKRLVARLRHRAAAINQEKYVVVAVGYTASYAGYVHENLANNHPNGMAKFLEMPLRLLADVLAAKARELYRRGYPPSQAMLAVASMLLYESQQLVPIKTGALKASGFYRLEEVRK